MRLFLTPSPDTAPTDNGIGRILHAMGKHLPAWGVEFTADAEHADVVAFHAGTALGERVDVLHCHGLYWSDLPHSEFNRSNNVANQRIIEAARRARIITVPSDWVAEPFRRDMRLEPEIIGHGIDVDEWSPGENAGYILWNKNRPTDVCDPTPAWKLAEAGLSVVSTFGPRGKMIPHLRVTGQLPYDQMRPIIASADLYLATAPETFGIGTLEAMACGVPVLGYDWCGTRDLVKHRETGWLVPVGDIDGLREGAEWLRKHRKKISKAARQFASGFDWKEIMGRYFEVYQRVQEPERSGVSIVITNYNYGHWLKDSVMSCLRQTVPPDEIIIVDDGSTDKSRQVIERFTNEKVARAILQKNQGVAAARNNGIAAAAGPFIVCLDADDMIAPNYIAALRPALERDRGLGVAYPGVRFLHSSGQDSGHSTFRHFSWEVQSTQGIPPPTCIPSGSMFRKAMWERCGGYKQKYAPGEDTEFWTHGLSLGFTAQMVTPEALFWYRGHAGSASRTKKYVAIDDNKPWLWDKLFPMAAPSARAPDVKSYVHPVVSIIMPVGPGHEQYVPDAVESVIGQTSREWELVLIDDTGDGDGLFKIRTMGRYPFIKWHSTHGRIGAGGARNIGIEAARGSLVLFLDADDWLRPDAVELMMQAMASSDGLYAFSDFYTVKGKEVVQQSVFPYDRAMYLERQVMHSVTALVPTAWAREIGGFDASLPGWEEYDFFMRLAVLGHCGTCVRQPLFYYRVDSGTRRKMSQDRADELNAGFAERFKGAKMAPCCGQGGEAILEVKRALGLIPRDQEPVNVQDLPNEVRLEFTGTWSGPVGFQVNGRTYYGAQDDMHRFINAPREDVEKLVLSGKWAIVGAPAARPPSISVPIGRPPLPERPNIIIRRG